MNVIKSTVLAATMIAGGSFAQAAPMAAPLGLGSINPDITTFGASYDYVAGNAGTVSYDGGAVVRNVGTFSVNVGLNNDFFVNGRDDYINPNTGDNLMQISNGEYSFSALIDDAGVFVSGGEIKLSGNATEDGVNFDPFRDFLVGTIVDFGYNGGTGKSASPAVLEFIVDVFSSPDARIGFGSLAGVIIGEANRSSGAAPINFSTSFNGTEHADTFRIATVPTPSMGFLMIGGFIALVVARKSVK